MVRSVDERYLSWVRAQECFGGPSHCGGGMVAHHVTGRGMGGSKRDDRDTIPMCTLHHSEYHNRGELRPFNAQYTRQLMERESHDLLKRYLDYPHPHEGLDLSDPDADLEVGVF